MEGAAVATCRAPPAGFIPSGEGAGISNTLRTATQQYRGELKEAAAAAQTALLEWIARR